MRRIIAGNVTSLLSVLIVLCGLLSVAQTAPTTAPEAAKVVPTPEQLALINQIKNASPDQAMPKVDAGLVTKDGQPNANFGKIQSGFLARHNSFLKRKEQPIDLLFIGDSITQGWEGSGKKVWDDRYGKLNAANFGISGDKTEHVLWRIENGELDGISPKVVVLMIGTNNSGSNPPERITAGVKAVVSQIRAKLPESKLLLLGIFPRAAKATDGPRTKVKAVNEELAKLDDGKKIFYLEIWNQFLTDDGTLTKEVMPDALHPNDKGYQIWADAMQPKLDELMK